MVSEVIQKMITYFDGDARRINHALKVYGFSKSISGLEQLSEEERLIVELAAVLHDIGIKPAEAKYNSSAGKYQEIEGPPVAEKLLEEVGAGSQVIERVCFLIGHHHSYGKIDGIDFQILVEADFLVNIFEDNMDIDAIRSVKNKYFKTAAGSSILESLYKV